MALSQDIPTARSSQVEDNPTVYDAFYTTAKAWYVIVGLLYLILMAFLVQRAGAAESPEAKTRRELYETDSITKKDYSRLADASTGIERSMMLLLGLGLACMVFRHFKVVARPHMEKFDPYELWLVQTINVFWSIVCALAVWLAHIESQMHLIQRDKDGGASRMDEAVPAAGGDRGSLRPPIDSAQNVSRQSEGGQELSNVQRDGTGMSREAQAQLDHPGRGGQNQVGLCTHCVKDPHTGCIKGFAFSLTTLGCLA